MTGEKFEKKFLEKNLSNFRRKIGGFSGLGMTATVEPCRPGRRPDGADRAKIPDAVQLATPGKRPVQSLYRPCNSGIMRHPFRDGTRKPTQADNMGRYQIIPKKNKPLRKPL